MATRVDEDGLCETRMGQPRTEDVTWSKVLILFSHLEAQATARADLATTVLRSNGTYAQKCPK